ncbi:MAG TPA: hypothetical protein VGE13_00305 [Candidatus Saccharimonadales bacterium]
MSNLADLADETIQSYIAPRGDVTRDWQIVVWQDGEWTPHIITGSPGKAADFIDLYNGRWARGHSNKLVAASDGEAEKAWRSHFSES